MAGTAVLYTPEVLALATALTRFPLTDDLPLRGNARSKSCGSTLEMGLLVEGGLIARLGLRSHACAIGQAAAAIFAQAAQGLSYDDISAAQRRIAAWLDGGAMPDWPGLSAIASAPAYPGRHGAVLLPWKAALSALPTGTTAR